MLANRRPVAHGLVALAGLGRQPALVQPRQLIVGLAESGVKRICQLLVRRRALIAHRVDNPQPQQRRGQARGARHHGSIGRARIVILAGRKQRVGVAQIVQPVGAKREARALPQQQQRKHELGGSRERS